MRESDPVTRFWQKVDKECSPGTGCWVWTAALAGGYGCVGWGDRIQRAHRVAYELLVGPIPDGLELDHLCHTNDPNCIGGQSCPHRRCVNPSHLEPVTGVVNVLRGQSPHAQAARQTHCVQGHEFTPQNTRVYVGRGQRVCLTCKRAAGSETQRRAKDRRREYMREYRARKRAS